MDNMQFDPTTQELNPTLLFSCQVDRRQSENHYHCHDFVEIGIVLQGSGIYHLDGEYVPVREGDVLIFNPGICHESIIRSPKERRTEYFVGFTDVAFQGMRKNHIELKQGGHVLSTSGKTKQELFRICRDMERETREGRPGGYFMRKAYLMQFLLTIVREQIEPEEVHTKGSEFESIGKKYVAEQIADYLDEHFAEKISLDQIAGNMYLSPFYISRIFKSEIGESPIHYLIRIRMEKARELLETQQGLSVAQVAERVGYEDAYHFSKLFKKAYGSSPSKYRRENN